MSTWYLDCMESNERHTKFRLFDPQGANCGTLCIITTDVPEFIANKWNGDVQWNGLFIDKKARLSNP